MPELSALITFTLACIAVVVVPGPSVTVIIANSIRSGVRAGLASVAGTQAGILIMIFILALGLETVIAYLAEVFVFIKIIGAIYLIWLGYKLLTSNGDLGKADTGGAIKSISDYFWQGFLVVWSNPKALFFFGAFIPQFVEPTGSAANQTLMLGLIFMGIATFFDSLYAIAAGGAGSWLTRANVRRVEIVGGLCLIGGGLWLAFSNQGAPKARF